MSASSVRAMTSTIALPIAATSKRAVEAMDYPVLSGKMRRALRGDAPQGKPALDADRAGPHPRRDDPRPSRPVARARRPRQPPRAARACAEPGADPAAVPDRGWRARSEEHTSEIQSIMRISYAVFCLKKQKHDILSSEKHNGKNTRHQPHTRQIP